MSESTTDRRRFLAWLTALAATACSPGNSTNTQPSSVAPSTSTAPNTTRTSAPTSAPPTTAAAVEPLAGAPIDFAAPPFTLGVASGDPTDDAIVLWTRLTGPELPEEVPIVWELSADGDFRTLLATGDGTASAENGHAVRITPAGLPSATTLWYRFRAGDEVSPAGRTRTLPGADDQVDRFRFGVSSCQLMETGHWAAHRDIAATDLDLVVWLGDYIYEGGGSSELTGRAHEGGTATDIDGYRRRYAQYRSDPALQAAQAAHPWFVIWDDHEVENDYDAAVDPNRRLDAYRAWWENQPVRTEGPTEVGLRIHRSITVGDLLRLTLVDVRQYADGTTLLGDEQRTWLAAELENDRRWTVIGSPVLVSGLEAPTNSDEPLLPYSWDGYRAERAELVEQLRGSDSVIVSGDLHTSMVLEAKADPLDPPDTIGATEFMAPAISSAFPERFAGAAPLLSLFNPQLRHIDTRNGWMLVEVEPDQITVEFRFVADVTDPESDVEIGPRFTVSAGSPIARQL